MNATIEDIGDLWYRLQTHYQDTEIMDWRMTAVETPQGILTILEYQGVQSQMIVSRRTTARDILLFWYRVMRSTYGNS